MVAVSTAVARKAAAAGTAGTAGKVIFGMNATNVALVGTALAVAGGIGWYGWSSDVPDPQPTVVSTATPAAVNARPDPAEPTRSPNVRKLPSREARDQLLQAIRAARQRSAATSSPTARHPPTLSAPTPSTTIDRDSDDADRAYVREAVQGLLPMITDCYKAALETEPALAGNLVVKFTIEGEPGVGGLVTESAIDPDQSEIRNPDLAECVQETMFALEIDPPTNGGTVNVTYPFAFQPK
jgi:hypothetical protein